MVVQAAMDTQGSARADSWPAAGVVRPEAETDALLRGHRVAAAGVAMLAVIAVALPVLLAIALIAAPGVFARALS